MNRMILAVPKGRILNELTPILEKANIRRSGAIAMGMDGVNTAVIPGNSTPEQPSVVALRTDQFSAERAAA